MPDQIDSQHVQHLQALTRQMGDYIALFEEAAQRIEKHELLNGKRLEENEHYFKQRLRDIQQASSELSSVVTQAGAARWRVSAEAALKQGEAHLDELQNAVQNFKLFTQENYQRMQDTATRCAERMHAVAENIELESLQNSVKSNVAAIDDMTTKVSQRAGRWLKRFHWEQLSLIFIVAVFVTFLTSMYITDEFPWESHAQVVAEHNAGKLLLKAWPHLPAKERADIRHAAMV